MKLFFLFGLIGLLGGYLVGCGGPVDPQAQRVRQLMAQVRQAPPEQRLQAAEELGKLKAAAAVPALLAAMSDSQFAVRLAAIAALGQIRDPNAVPGLLSVLGDGSAQLRKAAVDALGEIGDGRALQPLLDRLQDEEVVVRYSVAVALGKLGPGALESLLKRLKDGTPTERAGAVYALGGLRQPAATEAILGALADPNLTVRRNAVDALGRAKDDRAVPVLAGLLAQPLSAEDRTRYRAQSQEKLSEKLYRDTAAVLREREVARAVPSGGSYPHQAAQRRAILDKEAARISELVTPPLTEEKLAAIGSVVADRLGSDQFARLSREQRATAITKELVMLNDLVKPPRGSEKEDQIAQILARRVAREWWDKLGPKGQEQAVRRELAQRFEDQLKHEEVEMRQAAANGLAAVGSPSALHALVNALGGHDRAAREDAQAALQGLGEAALVPLTKVVTSKEYAAEVRERAMDLLASSLEQRGLSRSKENIVLNAGRQELSAVMLTVLQEGEPEFRLQAAEVLARLRVATPAVLSPLLQALKGADATLRRGAARALGQLGNKSATEPLLAALGDSSAEVRGAVAEALGLLGEKRAGAPILAQLRAAITAEQTDLIMACTRALGRLQEHEAVEPIAALLKRTGKDDRDLVSAAADALGQIRDPRAVEPLMALVLSNNWGPCFDAARALGHIGDVRAVPALVARANRKSYPEFPAVSLEALGRIRAPQAVQALVEVLKAPDHATHKFAAEALIAQGETALPVMMELLGGPDEKLRGLAAQILGYIGKPAVAPLVQFTANPPNTASLGAAIYALSAIRDERTVEPLVGLLKHAEPDIRANAAWALGFSSDKRVLESLQAAATDADPKVRAAAEAAAERVQSDLANARASTSTR